MDKRHIKIRVTGFVQGVSFRSSAKQEAKKLGLTGFARNEHDGSVYIEAEGPHDQLQKLVAWCQEGSPDAQVKSVESSVHKPLGHQGFKKL
jgi:acylphosphatase